MSNTPSVSLFKNTPGASYNEAIVRFSVVMAMFWSVIGMAVGLLIAVQLAYPDLLAFLPTWLQEYVSFGRLRPLHTSGVIFAFGGTVLLGTSFHVVQRTTGARLFGDPWLPWFVMLGYQLFILLAASGYVLGVSQGREYAEPEWYVDLWLTVVWVAYLGVFLGTLIKRKEPHIYVANWFYLAFIVTVAMLHLVNNAAVPLACWVLKATAFMRGFRMPSFNGGMGTMRWAFS